VINSGRKIVLRDTQNGEDRRKLWAELKADGSFQITGLDLGPLSRNLTGDGSYEWELTVSPEDVPRVVEVLGGESGEDVMEILAQRYTGAASSDVERLIRENGIPATFYCS
jgi:hypothetical protein